jgi:hypothetical protein
MYELEDNLTSYNLAIARIKSVLGGMLFSFQEEIPNFEQLTPNAYKALRNIPDYYPIYSSVSLDYINFIAILQPISEESIEYKVLVNEISGDESEWDFLKGLNEFTESKGYYAIDLYVEDMIASDRLLNFKGIRLNDSDSLVIEAPRENITECLNDSKLNDYLQMNQRQVNYGSELKNKEWNLFLFEKRDVQPRGIILDLKTYNDGEHLELNK